jgi:hypothetical protein
VRRASRDGAVPFPTGHTVCTPLEHAQHWTVFLIPVLHRPLMGSSVAPRSLTQIKLMLDCLRHAGSHSCLASYLNSKINMRT